MRDHFTNLPKIRENLEVFIFKDIFSFHWSYIYKFEQHLSHEHKYIRGTLQKSIYQTDAVRDPGMYNLELSNRKCVYHIYISYETM